MARGRSTVVVAMAALLVSGCAANFSGSLMPTSSSSPTIAAQPASLSEADLARLGRCIGQMGPLSPQDRVDSAKVWRTTPETARAALKDITPAYETDPAEVLLVLLDGEFVDQYGMDDDPAPTPQMWFATPTFESAEDYLPGTGMDACDPDLAQGSSPLYGVDLTILGPGQVLPVGMIRGDESIPGVTRVEP